MNNHDIIVDNSFCDTSIHQSTFNQTCFIKPCEGVEWIVSEWSQCIGTCTRSIKTRDVYCANKYGKIYNENYCKSNKKPEYIEQCFIFDCYFYNYALRFSYEWHASTWSNVSLHFFGIHYF